MEHPQRSQTPNQVVSQIIIPFFLVFIFINVIGYFLFVQINGNELHLNILADISLILIFIPFLFFMILALLFIVLLNFFIINFSRISIRRFKTLKNTISRFDQRIHESSVRIISPVIKLESFFGIFKQ